MWLNLSKAIKNSQQKWSIQARSWLFRWFQSNFNATTLPLFVSVKWNHKNVLLSHVYFYYHIRKNSERIKISRKRMLIYKAQTLMKSKSKKKSCLFRWLSEKIKETEAPVIYARVNSSIDERSIVNHFEVNLVAFDVCVCACFFSEFYTGFDWCTVTFS